MWSRTHAPFENVFGVLSDIWSHTHILYGIMPTYWVCVIVGNKSAWHQEKCYACLWEPVDYHGATPTYRSLNMCILIPVATSFAYNSSCWSTTLTCTM